MSLGSCFGWPNIPTSPEQPHADHDEAVCTLHWPVSLEPNLKNLEFENCSHEEIRLISTFPFPHLYFRQFIIVFCAKKVAKAYYCAPCCLSAFLSCYGPRPQLNYIHFPSPIVLGNELQKGPKK